MTYSMRNNQHERQLEEVIKSLEELNNFREMGLRLNEDPRKLPFIRDEIAESWIRSKKTGVMPDALPSKKMLLKSTLRDKVLKDNKLLIQAALPIVHEAVPFLSSRKPFAIGLLDRNAIVLFMHNFPINEISQPGTDLSESMVGTSAHSICLDKGKPSYVLEPEIYNEVMRFSKFVFAVPIRDAKNEIIATFVAPYYRQLRQTPEERDLLTWLTAWQYSMAQRIEDAIQRATPKFFITKLGGESGQVEPRGYDLRAIHTFEDIAGKSPAMVKAKSIARKISGIPESILLIGDSGTGKELFAHAIHNEAYSQNPFVAINCAAIPRSLIESELFGYEGGSFTGAERKGRVGKIEMANGGTLFLDEIGDMPLDLQPVLLRVLEDKRIMRVGGNKYIPVNFRVIAATNRNLYEMVERKEFREDLYFRLAAFKISIPPLKNRGEDIISLAKFFIEKQCMQLNRPLLELDTDAQKKIMAYHWPGNVRELKNCMLWAVSMAENKIKIEDLPEEITCNTNSDSNSSQPRTMQEFERQAITEAMTYCNQNISDAAQVLGWTRPTLYRKLKDYGLFSIVRHA